MKSRRLLALATLLLVAVFAMLGCTAGWAGVLTGEVRFARDIELPEGATVIVTLRDISLADAPSPELGRDEIQGAGKLPTRFSVTYDPGQISPGNEYALQAEVYLADQLLYVNDTVHPVLTRGAPRKSDVRVVSTDPVDNCDEPLPGRIHSGFGDRDLPADAELRVRLVDVSDPEFRVIVSETTQRGIEKFPISFELPFEGVAISRHRRYELEAEVWFAGNLGLHIPRAEWRRIGLPHCPNPELMLVNDVFPVGTIQEE